MKVKCATSFMLGVTALVINVWISSSMLIYRGRGDSAYPKRFASSLVVIDVENEGEKY
jgi:hypothetical protein